VSSVTRQLPSDRVHRRSPRTSPSIPVRGRAWLRRARLDRLLAQGTSPGESPELALRAIQLTRPRHRRALASNLEEVVSIAQGRRHGRAAAPPLATRDIRASSSVLLELAQTLRENRDVYASGVALAQHLLTDGSGPLYVYGLDDELWHAGRDAIAALGGSIPQAPSG
jgi:hypothetical protein